MFLPVILTLEILYVKARTVSDERAPPCAHAGWLFYLASEYKKLGLFISFHCSFSEHNQRKIY